MSPAPKFSELTLERLDEVGIPPSVVAAVGLRETEDGVIEIPYGRRAERSIQRCWEIDLEPDPWPESQAPGVWWPAGRDGSTVIVCLGATEALFLTSQLFRVGFDGELYRRQDLPPVLEDVIPVALPCTFPDLAFEWYRDPERGVRDLLEEIVIEERLSVFLALPRPPIDFQPITPQSEPGLERFVDAFLKTGESYGITPGLALLPWGATWSELLAPYRGAARRAALGGIFDYWSATSILAPPLTTTTKGDTP